MPRILVVEDDAAVRLAIKTLLELEGFDVTLAECGSAGLEAIGFAPFDIALVDMFMPGMSGGDTIKALRERAPSVAIIAMSGLASPDGPRAETDLLSIARRLGAAGGLRKPFRPTELLAALDACFGSAAGSAPQRVGSTTPSMRRLTDPPRPP